MSHNSGSRKAVSTEITALRKQIADLKESAVARRRVEDAVRAAEMLHRATLDEAPVGILRLDPAGRLLYVNPVFITLLGYESRQDFSTIGELRGVFADPARAESVIRSAGENPVEVSLSCVRRDGSFQTLPFLLGRVGEEGVTAVLLGAPSGAGAAP